MGCWREEAKCRGAPVEAYVTSNLPKATNMGSKVRAQAAKRLCAGCPVVPECAEDAYQQYDTDVVRAGIALVDIDGSALARQRQNLKRIAQQWKNSNPPR